MAAPRRRPDPRARPSPTRRPLRLTTSAELDDVTGRFFDGTRDARAHEQAYDPAARAELRRRTDALVAPALTT